MGQQSKWRLQMLRLWKEDGGANKESTSDEVVVAGAISGIAGNEIPIVTTDHTLHQQQQQHNNPQHMSNCNGKQVSFNLKNTSHETHDNSAYSKEPAVLAATSSSQKAPNPEVSHSQRHMLLVSSQCPVAICNTHHKWKHFALCNDRC